MKRLTTCILFFLTAAILCMGQSPVNVMVDIENIARGGSLPKPTYNGTEKGIVVVQVIVDKQGNVTGATPGATGSTTQDSALLSAAEASARRARFTLKEGVDGLSTGNIIYGFGVELSPDNIPGKAVSRDGSISIKDLLDYHTDGTYTIHAFYFGMSNPEAFTFFVQEREDELFPIQLADNGAETQDQIAFLQELKGGEPITIKGTLTTIAMGKESLKGFTDATILEMPVRKAEDVTFSLEKPDQPRDTGGLRVQVADPFRQPDRLVIISPFNGFAQFRDLIAHGFPLHRNSCRQQHSENHKQQTCFFHFHVDYLYDLSSAAADSPAAADSRTRKPAHPSGGCFALVLGLFACLLFMCTHGFMKKCRNT